MMTEDISRAVVVAIGGRESLWRPYDLCRKKIRNKKIKIRGTRSGS